MQIRLTGLCPRRLTDPLEQLNQIQLIEEIVLVPEDQLVVQRVIVDT